MDPQRLGVGIQSSVDWTIASLAIGTPPTNQAEATASPNNNKVCSKIPLLTITFLEGRDYIGSGRSTIEYQYHGIGREKEVHCDCGS